MRSIGELLYLLMIIGAFTTFAIALAWAERTWRPQARAQESHGVPHLAE